MTKERLITLVKILGVVLSLYFFIVGIRGVGEAFKIVNKQEPSRVVILLIGDETLAEKARASLSAEKNEQGEPIFVDLGRPTVAVKGEQVTLQFIYNDGKLKDAFVAKVREHLKQPEVLGVDAVVSVKGIKNLAGKLMDATSAKSGQARLDAQVTLKLAVLGFFIGVLVTSIVQSSSTTTSIIVGMVAAEAIGVRGAIFMVMGANLGTTITAKLVSLGHITRTAEFRRAFAAASVHDAFNLITTAILFPLEYFFGVLYHSSLWLTEVFENMGGIKLGDPLKAATGVAVDGLSRLLGEHPFLVLLVSVVLTFLMLWSIVKLLQSLVLKKLEAFFDAFLFRNVAIAFVVGIILTVLVQSSSITTSLIIPLAGAGVLRLSQVFPYTMGANLGTTVTGMLAALATTNPAAITVAFAHSLFNIFGAVIFLPFRRIREIPIYLAERLSEFCLKNRLIPFAIILLAFFVIPLIFTWSTLAEIFNNQ